MYKILLATDGSEHSIEAAKEVIKIAGPMQAEVTAISVVQATPVYVGYDIPASPSITLEIMDGLEDAARRILESVKEQFKEKEIEIKIRIEKGQPAEVICSIAKEENYDLVVVGSRGLGGIKKFFLGSVSNSIVMSSEVPVLVVK